MPNNSRKRGIAYEVKIMNELKELGFNVGTTRNYSKAEDDNKVDIYSIDNQLPIKIQIKKTQNTPQYFAIRSQATVDPKDFCLI